MVAVKILMPRELKVTPLVLGTVHNGQGQRKDEPSDVGGPPTGIFGVTSASQSSVVRVFARPKGRQSQRHGADGRIRSLKWAFQRCSTPQVNHASKEHVDKGVQNMLKRDPQHVEKGFMWDQPQTHLNQIKFCRTWPGCDTQL